MYYILITTNPDGRRGYEEVSPGIAGAVEVGWEELQALYVWKLQGERLQSWLESLGQRRSLCEDG